MGSEARRGRWTALSAAAALALAALAARAETITLRWRYAAPERIVGFRVHTGPAAGQYTHSIDVGRPAQDAHGVYHAEVEVADGEATHLAVSAYDARGVESPPSADRLHPAAPGAPSKPGRPEVVEP